MKKQFLIIALIGVNLIAYSQRPRWEVIIGTQGRDDCAYNLTNFYDKGYLLVYNFDNEGSCLIKTDINGNVLWEKTFINSIAVFGDAVTYDKNGNIYFCGGIWVNESTCWPFITKLDSCGNQQWCKLIKDASKMYGGSRDLLINENNLLVVLMRFESLDKTDQIFLTGIDLNGEILWSKSYASKNDYPQINLASPKDLTRSGSDYIISGYCYWPFPDDSNHVFLRPFFIGIDSVLNEKWVLPFAVMDSVFGEAYSSIALNDSIIVGIGERWISENSKNSILMYFDKNGNEKSYVQVSNEAIGNGIIANVSKDVAKINDTVLITSSIWGTSDTGILSELIINIDGTIYKKHESVNNAIFNSYIIKTSDSNFVVTGTIQVSENDWDIVIYKINDSLESVPFDTNLYVYDSLCPYPITSETIDLTDCMVWTDIGEVPLPEEYYSKLNRILVRIFPNPAINEITVNMQNTEYHQNMELQCFDMFSRLLHRQKIQAGQPEAGINVSEWKDGIYLVVIKSNGKVLGKGKFVVN